MQIFQEASTEKIISRLLQSSEPSIRYQALVNILGADPDSNQAKQMQEEIRNSSRVRTLLSERDRDGKIRFHPYAKWYGAHWVLAALADLNYPPGDKSLVPLREQVYDWLFSDEHMRQMKHHHVYSGPITEVKGRVRIHASMEGNALYSTIKLGLDNTRADELAKRLLETQWPDGGWNCDKSPKATHSSFNESLLPLRGLIHHAKSRKHQQSEIGARRAAELFLKRHLYLRLSNCRIISQEFLKLHYPSYWHYDILCALKVMAEGGMIRDSRCHDALEVLRSKRLPDGGFPAEKKYYRVSKDMLSGRSLVDWGGMSKSQMNEFVTADALQVLKQSDTSTQYETILE
jgi:hypothetical protein